MEILGQLHKEISMIKKHHDEMRMLSGEGFNVFEVLGLESSEVGLHSRLIAELIDPVGSHGQGNIFLKLFLDEIGRSDFSLIDVKVDIEVGIGKINEDFEEGGRLDILIQNSDKEIVIENKIYASLGKKQLKRYVAYATRDHREGKVYLLTLFIDDVDIKLCEELGVKPITYENHILSWLQSCLKESASIPIIRETITQYISVVKKLTKQILKNPMNQDILNMLKKNPEYVDSLDEIYKTLSEFSTPLAKKYLHLLGQSFTPVKTELKNGLIFEMYYKDDVEGLWFGLKLLKSEAVDSSISESIEAELCQVIKITLKDLNKYHSSNTHFTWYTPTVRTLDEKFINMPFAELIKMDNDEAYLKAAVYKVSDEANEIKNNIDQYFHDNELILDCMVK